MQLMQNTKAPGEAEAELAKLNAEGMIDAILTDDSDTLVFGGRCVIRRLESFLSLFSMYFG